MVHFERNLGQTAVSILAMSLYPYDITVFPGEIEFELIGFWHANYAYLAVARISTDQRDQVQAIRIEDLDSIEHKQVPFGKMPS